jgi:hypothetical protein
MEPQERIEGFPQPLIAPLPEAFLAQIELLFGKEVLSRLESL